MFQGRSLIIATKHSKERVISPIIQETLQTECFVDLTFDTDQLGTFTGEVDRIDDAVTTARLKCVMAMEKNKCDLGIASEGSFGNHPELFFTSANHEVLLFIDQKNKIEISEQSLSTETNYYGNTIQNESELIAFSTRVLFPSHGIILRKSSLETVEIYKGIMDWETLIKYYRKLSSKYGDIYAETDMRAMCNPTRMAHIQELTRKLVLKIASYCPSCHFPGFGVTDVVSGLPCALCQFPTQSTFEYIYTCQSCNHIKSERYPHKKTTENPMYCQNCNP
jgi:hypothetical protein